MENNRTNSRNCVPYIVLRRRSRKHFWLWFNLTFIHITNKDGIRLMAARHTSEKKTKAPGYRKWKNKLEKKIM